MKVLLISDKVVEHIYSNTIAERMKDIDFVISCGDLPNYYLEFIVTTLNKPLYYVKGNHDSTILITEEGTNTDLPEGCINLNQKIIEQDRIILMGLEGSMKYNGGDYQYTDTEMCWKINKLKPKLYLTKLSKKRYIDILVTHAPPYKIQDQEDLCHRGFRCFNKFIEEYKPKYLIHGHTHLYGINNEWLTIVNGTKIINAYGYRIINLEI